MVPAIQCLKIILSLWCLTEPLVNCSGLQIPKARSLLLIKVHAEIYHYLILCKFPSSIADCSIIFRKMDTRAEVSTMKLKRS